MATGVSSRRKKSTQNYALAYDEKLERSKVLALPYEAPRAIEIPTDMGHLFQADNLMALLWLCQNTEVRGKVRCVYIDPPYATAMAFVDRKTNHAYNDHLGDRDYLEFLRRRLIVLHDLLAEDGSIFVHLDQNMVFEAKLLMDEVFGRGNFRNFITRKKCNTKNYTRNSFGNIADHILFYTKSPRYVWHRPAVSWSDEKMVVEYPCTDKKTGRRYKKVPIHAPGVRRGETGKPWRGQLPPLGKHWQYPPSMLDEMDAKGDIYWSPNGNPRRKVYFDSSKGIPLQDIWMDFKDAHNQNVCITGYPTEKNFDLVKQLVAATSNPGDLVLDCFCGSGTTLEAAMSLERRFIGIDLSDAAIEVTVKRLSNGRQPMGDFVGVRGKRRRPIVPKHLFSKIETPTQT